MKNYITEAREAVSQYNVVGGISLVDLQDILAVLVGAKSTPELTGKLAAKGIQGLVDMSLPELESAGLSKLQAQRVHAGCLMAQSLKKVGRKEKRYTIRSPKDAANYMMDEMSTLLQEHFVVLYLNIKNEIISKQTIFVGSLNSSIVHPREIMREAVKLSSASFICLHNHPSGNPAPSPEDIAVTKRLQEVGSICGVELLDHVIIGDQTFISLNEKGYMQ